MEIHMKKLHPDLVEIGMKYSKVIEILGAVNVGQKEVVGSSDELRECNFSFAEGAWFCILYFDEHDCLSDKAKVCVR